MTHIAFRVTRQQYVAAKALLASEGVPFEEQDHEVCLSVYLHDPDGIQVELTTYH